MNSPSPTEKRSNQRWATAVISIFLGLQLTCTIFQLQLFPFSYYPMYASLKPEPAAPRRQLAMDVNGLWGRQQYYAIFGLHRDGSDEFLDYTTYFSPLFRDQFWWRLFAGGLSRQGANQVLRSLDHFAQPRLDVKIVGLRLYRFEVPFDHWLAEAKLGNLAGNRGRQLIAEYRRSP